jgi:hypothetical protein
MYTLSFACSNDSNADSERREYIWYIFREESNLQSQRNNCNTYLSRKTEGYAKGRLLEHHFLI